MASSMLAMYNNIYATSLSIFDHKLDKSQMDFEHTGQEYLKELENSWEHVNQ